LENQSSQEYYGQNPQGPTCNPEAGDTLVRRRGHDEKVAESYLGFVSGDDLFEAISPPEDEPNSAMISLVFTQRRRVCLATGQDH
jgi:hypothetical protein